MQQQCAGFLYWRPQFLKPNCRIRLNLFYT